MTRGQGIRLLFATLAVVFFAAPVGARLLGVTAESFENRRLAEPPKLAQGWDAFAQTSQYLTDRMPLRAQAVRANTRIWLDVFETDPPYSRDTTLANDQALPFAGAVERDGGDIKVGQDQVGLHGAPVTATSGKDGWIYVPAQFSIACDRRISNDQILESWSTLLRAIRADGHETALFVAPAKGSVYPEHLPDEYPSDHCGLPAVERFWRALARDGAELGIHELRSELLRIKEHAGDGLYQIADTHWSTLGALTLVDAVLDELGDGVELKPSEIVARGSVPYTGDLSVVGGNAKTDTRDEYGIERAPDAPRVPGRTLILCDSFGYLWFRLFKPYFEDVRYVSWIERPELIVDEIRKADLVIVEGDEMLTKVQAAKNGLSRQVARRLQAGER